MTWRDCRTKEEISRYMAGRLDELRAAFAATVLRQPGDLCRVLERLAYDDAILFDDGSRLEYVHLDEGKPQFRLYESDLRLIGVVIVHADAYLPAIHRRLTAYLEQRGTPLRRVQYKECGALTPAGAKVHYLPQLFRYAPKAKKKKAEGAKVDKQHA